MSKGFAARLSEGRVPAGQRYKVDDAESHLDPEQAERPVVAHLEEEKKPRLLQWLLVSGLSRVLGACCATLPR